MVLNLDKLWFQPICNLLSLNYVVGRIMVLATYEACNICSHKLQAFFIFAP